MLLFRTHLLKGYKGDKSFLPEGVTFTPAFIIVGSTFVLVHLN